MSTQRKMFAFWDVKAKKLVRLPKKDLDRKLGDMLALLKEQGERLKEVDGYALDSFDVTIAVKGGVMVFAAEGGLRLCYKKKSV